MHAVIGAVSANIVSAGTAINQSHSTVVLVLQVRVSTVQSSTLGQVVHIAEAQLMRLTVTVHRTILAIVQRVLSLHFPNTTHRSLLLEDENVERIAEKLREVIDRWMAEHWQNRPA